MYLHTLSYNLPQHLALSYRSLHLRKILLRCTAAILLPIEPQCPALPPGLTLSDGSKIYTMAPANRWTREQRLALHLLHTEFDMASIHIVEALNIKFDAHLRSCGFEGGIGGSALMSLYRDRKRNHENWADIHS